METAKEFLKDILKLTEEKYKTRCELDKDFRLSYIDVERLLEKYSTELKLQVEKYSGKLLEQERENYLLEGQKESIIAELNEAKTLLDWSFNLTLKLENPVQRIGVLLRGEFSKKTELNNANNGNNNYRIELEE